MKRLLLLIVAISFACRADAHEFWLQPGGFRFKTLASTGIQLMVGEDYTGEPATMTRSRVVRLMQYAREQTLDLANTLAGDSVSSFKVSLHAPGGNLVAFNSNNKLITLEAAKFNDYLRSEGLEHILRLRTGRQDTLKMGREMYQRCAKTLMQQGNSLDSVYATFTGMPMEIIPTQHPYRIKTTSSAAFQVLYKGKPLQHALVLAWHKTNGKTTHTTARSDADGRVVFPINPAGSWMISAVHMVPYENATEADWQSYWASYTFGYQ